MRDFNDLAIYTYGAVMSNSKFQLKIAWLAIMVRRSARFIPSSWQVAVSGNIWTLSYVLCGHFLDFLFLTTAIEVMFAIENAGLTCNQMQI